MKYNICFNFPPIKVWFQHNTFRDEMKVTKSVQSASLPATMFVVLDFV